MKHFFRVWHLRTFFLRALPLVAMVLLTVLSIGCGGHHHRSDRDLPPAPEIAPAPRMQPHPTPPPTAEGTTNSAPRPIHVDPHARVIWSQVGWASWYGPNYHNKRAANGEIYDQNQMTAAHNMLPLNSIVRVTNLRTRQQALVRITDRGPFVGDRVIDLSMEAAKQLGIYISGTAEVRLDVLEAPKPIDTGGRWCIQMGAFQTEESALRMKEHLLRHNRTATVIEFKGPTGYWVRLRVPQDDKQQTIEVFEHTEPTEGGMYMVRLD
jgi:rare lipoprotein A